MSEEVLFPKVYPLTIIAARYNGTYEGAKYVAFNEDAKDIEDASGNDITCATFFDVYGRFRAIGRGDTPDEALASLIKQLEEPLGWTKANPFMIRAIEAWREKAYTRIKGA